MDLSSEHISRPRHTSLHKTEVVKVKIKIKKTKPYLTSLIIKQTTLAHAPSCDIKISLTYISEYGDCR